MIKIHYCDETYGGGQDRSFAISVGQEMQCLTLEVVDGDGAEFLDFAVEASDIQGPLLSMHRVSGNVVSVYLLQGGGESASALVRIYDKMIESDSVSVYVNREPESYSIAIKDDSSSLISMGSLRGKTEADYKEVRTVCVKSNGGLPFVKSVAEYAITDGVDVRTAYDGGIVLDIVPSDEEGEYQVMFTNYGVPNLFESSRYDVTLACRKDPSNRCVISVLYNSVAPDLSESNISI